MTDHVREALLVGGLTAGALALRFLGLAEGDFWGDEVATRGVVDRAPGGVLVEVQDAESAPHLYYLLAWAWSSIFGLGEAGLRSLSAIAGTLIVPVAYLTFRQVGLRTEALIAGALAAVSPLLVWYSQEARAYSLFALLTAVALLFFVRTLGDLKVRALVGWSIASAGALLTHYFALFTVAGMAAVLLYRHRARWRWIALSSLPTAVAGFALLPTVATQRSGGHQDWITDYRLHERVLQLPEHFLTGFSYPPLPLVLLAGLFMATAAVGLLIHRPRGQLVGGSLLAVVAVGVGIPLLAVLAERDFIITRNLLGAIIPLLLAVGVGLGASRLRPVGPIVALALVGLLAGISVAAEYDHEVERPSWGAAAQAVTETGDPDLVIACCGYSADPAPHYFGFEGYDRAAFAEVEVDEVVLATILRPDRRPNDDYCGWGSPCQADDPGPPANPRALSRVFSSIFDRVETFTRGSITLERYRSASPVSLLGTRSRVRLHNCVFAASCGAVPRQIALVVGDSTEVHGVELLARRR